ncbi:MAG: hypothetical protein E6J63_16230 [Deltaproteobacteria bacterium]|nr:MAG: hypothetical protein E6J63_16230 [Deltaproteobacteria bacterium]
MKPRQLLHRGVVQSSGLLFDEALLGAGEARARIVAEWESTALVLRFGPLLVLRFGRPRPVDCARATGLPLVESAGVLYGAPLEADERAALTVSPPASVVVRGGEAIVLGGGAEEHPASWIDLDRFDVVEVESLGEGPPAPASSAPVPVEVGRSGFGVPAADPEAARVAADLASASERERTTSEASWGAGAFGLVASAALRALARLAGLLAPPGPRSGAGGQRRGVWDGLRDAIDRALVRLAVWTRASRLLGARQAEYLRKLFRSLDEGDVDEALRTAIPLADPASEGASPSALGLPAPRRSLAIRPRPSGRSRSIGLGAEIYEELRSRYRAIFNRLVSHGRIDEAAFVLAELLGAADEAVDFLERHGRLLLAAELAEARELPAPRLVRQWMLAGETDRALTIARQRSAFGAAVLYLETRLSPLAPILRLHWADWLATTGQYGAAIEVAWKVTEARRLARRWLDHLLALGGPAASKALVRQLELSPGRFAELGPKVIGLLEPSDEVGREERVALAEQLARCKEPNPALAALARPAVRACVRDGSVAPDTLRALLDLSGDGALAADVPPVKQKGRTTPASLRLEVEDCGVMQVFDAALLTRRKMLVALGESGARVVGPDGRTTRAFAAPSFRLIISDHLDRALALARRGEVSRVHLLDLLSGGSRDLGELPDLSAFAPDFDGALWFAALGHSIVAVDLAAAGLRTSWRVTALPGRVLSVARSSTSLSIAIEAHIPLGTPELEVWRYDLPHMVLRDRTAAAWSGGLPALGANGALAAIERDSADPSQVVWRTFTRDWQRGSQALTPEPALPIGAGDVRHPPVLLDRFFAVPAAQPGSSAIRVFSTKRDLPQPPEIVLMGADAPRARLQGVDGKPHLICCDDRGRLLACDLDAARLLVNTRL